MTPDPTRPDAGQARGQEVPLPEPVAWDWQRGDGLSAVSSSREISEANAAGMGGEVIPLVPLAQVEQFGRECAAAAVKGEREAVVAWLRAQGWDVVDEPGVGAVVRDRKGHTWRHVHDGPGRWPWQWANGMPSGASWEGLNEMLGPLTLATPATPTPTACTCGTTYADYQGPEEDCPTHGRPCGETGCTVNGSPHPHGKG